MAIRINNNITAMTANRLLNTNSADLSKRIERLSSGMRINRGADDAAGLAISEGMRAEILGMRQAVRNAEQGISMLQLAEGSLGEVSNMLRRMRELAVQSANSTMQDTNREGLTTEFNALFQEIDRIAFATSYNDQVLLTGFGNAVSTDKTTTTALDGFSGVKKIEVFGALPGTYRFTDSSITDNQITLSIDLPDGTSLTQTIDIGINLDSEGALGNLVATGTTLIANFDRLGVQVTLAGPGVDTGTGTLLTTSTDAEVAAGGSLTIGGQGVIVPVGSNLTAVATQINAILSGLDPAGSAEFLPARNSIQIDTAGHSLLDPNNMLKTISSNSYRDGLLDGKELFIQEGNGGVLQVGPRNNVAHRIGFTIADMRSTGPTLNLDGVSVANIESSRAALSRIDEAISSVAQQRGNLGAVQNRLQFTTGNLENSIENIQAAESAIRDADLAEEVSAFTRSQILSQAATAMAAQANAIPQSALQLLQ